MNAVPDRWKNKKPRAVTQQVEDVRAFMAAASAEANGSNPAQAQGLEQEQAAPAATAAGATQSEVDADELHGAHAAPEAVGEVAEPEAATDPGSGGGQASSRGEVNWEHKYKSLKGKHDADFARLNRIIDEQAKQLEHLHMMLAQQPQQDTRADTGPEPAKLPVAEDFTAEELDEFGPDLAKFITKAARREIAGALGDIVRRLDKVEREAAGARAHSQRVLTESFYEAMDRLVPQWRQLNTDRDFLTWLNGVDTFTGQTRISLLRQAEETKDAQRASAFFKAWLDETGRSGGEQPASPAVSGRRDLRSLVAPGRAAPSTGTTPRRTIAAASPDKQPEIITGADIKAFFEKRRTMSPEAFEAGRRAIAQALKEGRVVE